MAREAPSVRALDACTAQVRHQVHVGSAGPESVGDDLIGALRALGGASHGGEDLFTG